VSVPRWDAAAEERAGGEDHGAARVQAAPVGRHDFLTRARRSVSRRVTIPWVSSMSGNPSSSDRTARRYKRAITLGSRRPDRGALRND